MHCWKNFLMIDIYVREQLYLNCTEFLSEIVDHCIQDMLGFEEEYEMGLVYCDYMAQERGLTTQQFLEQLLEATAKGLED